MKTKLLVALLFTLGASVALADIDTEIHQLQTRWAEVNYDLEDDAQIEAFEALMAEADRVTANYPGEAAAWIWSGIIKSTFAGAKGGLGALGLAKDSKSDLEQGMELDADVLNGSAYASLGTLYFSVPGWPIGFGDDDKAEELLLKALALSPDSIDNNYFYASFLINEKRYDEAREYLSRAQHAAPRPQRLRADAGRQEDIVKALEQIEGK